MKNLTKETKLIIDNIKSSDVAYKIANILKDYDIEYYESILFSNYVEDGLSFRITGNSFGFSSTIYYNNTWIYENYVHITADEFLEEYQVRLEHKGFKGSYIRNNSTSWFGRIQNCGGDIITYTSNTLVGLYNEFIEAVDNYIDALTEIEKLKNKKEQKMDTENTIFTDDEIVAWRSVKIKQAIGDVSIYLMTNEKTFTRHDVLKALRQLYGPDIDLQYEDYRADIIEIVEEQCDSFNYERNNDGYKFVYTFIGKKDPDEDFDEDDDEELKDSIDTNEPSKKDPGKHTIKARQIRHMGLKPGDTCYFKVYDGGFVFDKDETACMDEIMQDLPGVTILYETTYKVDKNYNIRLRKNIFDIAGISDEFQDNSLIYYDMGK